MTEQQTEHKQTPVEAETVAKINDIIGQAMLGHPGDGEPVLVGPAIWDQVVEPMWRRGLTLGADLAMRRAKSAVAQAHADLSRELFTDEEEPDPEPLKLDKPEHDYVEKDPRPHSRACGITPHEHGSACHPNCPTCGGRRP